MEHKSGCGDYKVKALTCLRAAELHISASTIMRNMMTTKSRNHGLDMSELNSWNLTENYSNLSFHSCEMILACKVYLIDSPVVSNKIRKKSSFSTV